MKERGFISSGEGKIAVPLRFGRPGREARHHQIMGMPEGTSAADPVERMTFFVMGGGGAYPMRMDDPDFAIVQQAVSAHLLAHTKLHVANTAANAWEVITTDQALPEELQGHTAKTPAGSS